MRGKSSRWFPVAGGHQVLVLHEGGTYDSKIFTLKPAGWDHDHCTNCNERIPAMSLCWVTRTGRYVVLCVNCKAKLDEMGGKTNAT